MRALLLTVPLLIAAPAWAQPPEPREPYSLSCLKNRRSSSFDALIVLIRA